MLRLMLACLVIAATAGAASAQAQSGRLKTIVTNKAIKIAHRTDAVPFSYIDEKKEVAGYTIDLCKLIVASLERQLKVQRIAVQWVPVSTQTRFEAVASGKADIECGASTVTLSRMKEVDFSTFVFVESTGLVTKAEAGISHLKDLAGKRIAVITGTTNEKAMLARNQELKATIVTVKDREQAIAVLEAGAADAFASDKMLLIGTQYRDVKSLRMLPDDLSVEPYAIVLPRGDWALRLAVNTALAEIYRSGEILKIFDRWFSPVGLRPNLLIGTTFALGALPE